MKSASFVLASLVLAMPVAARAQASVASTAMSPATAGAIGRVVDSLVTGRPLAGAELWVDGSPTSVLTDSAGGYRVAELVPGWHALTFAHPALDTLGVAAPAVRVELLGPDVRVDLATPSSATFHMRVCGARPGEDEGVLVGIVEDAEDERAVAGARVEGRWLEWTVGREGLQRVPRAASVNADAAGRYALCFVPTDVVVGVSARAGERSSGAVDVELGRGRFAVRTVSIGRADAAVSGVVRDTLGRPIAGARAAIAGSGAEATTDSAGAFRITGAPAGSQMLEVRAVGFAPVRVPAVSRTSRPIVTQVVIGRAQVLPTISVVGRRAPRADVTGFEARRRSSAGYYLTQDQIRQRQPVRAFDVLRGILGVTVQNTPDGKHRLAMVRGGAGAGCTPTVYLDGVAIFDGPTNLDYLVRPHEIQAVEVYPSFVSVPNEFRTQNSTCGAVLVWTRTRSP